MPPPSAELILKARERLAASDPALAAAHAAVPPLPWRHREAGFAGLVQMVIEQQVSTASAAAIWRRFDAGLGQVTAASVLALDETALRGFGLSGPKARYIRGVAEAEASGRIDFPALQSLDDEAAIQRLTALKGIGRWTAELYLLFCEGRADMFPGGDLALQEGFRLAARLPRRPTEQEIYARAEAWRPYRGVAALLLWAYYSQVKRGAAPGVMEQA